jgi:ferredoxin
MTHCNMQHIPLSSAYLCQDCNSVGNCARQCPACASSVLMNLSGVLDREMEREEHSALNYTFPRSAAAAVAELEAMVA